MEFYQKHPVFGYTRLITTEDGLLVDRKRLTNYLWVEIPYEELLPVRGKVQRSIPLILTFFALFGAFGSWITEIQKPVAEQSNPALMGITGLAVLGLCYFTYTRWQNTFTLTTGQGDINWVAQPNEQAVMEQFVHDLRIHSKAYLHQRYAQFDSLLKSEEQLERWAWLYERKVVSKEEYTAFIGSQFQ